jgi:CheY-like chemotaxis protein
MAKIVCIEDEPDIREDAVGELTDAGHEVIAVENAKEGLQAILQHEPDLVICDCLMPIMTGGELLSTLREHYPQFDDTPFIFVSAHAEEGRINEGLALGADAYLTKPTDWDLFIETVETVLTKKQIR